MILLKKYPNLPVDLIFQYYTHPEREISPDHLLTALHTAAEMKHFDMVKIFFSHLARFNPPPLSPESAENTILNAAHCGHQDCLFYLLTYYPTLAVTVVELVTQKGDQALADRVTT